MKKEKIIVTLPARNEARTIGNVIKGIKKALAGKNFEIIVADDGSRDNTAEIAEKEGVYVFSHKKKMGLSKTFIHEMKLALKRKADIIIHIDADGQYEPDEIKKLIDGINEGYDLVLGSRFMGRIEYMPLIKKIGNKMFSSVISKISDFPIKDSQTGFRAFRREVAENIKIISDFTYTQEQILKAVNMGYSIKEVPVVFYKRKRGKSRLMKGPFQYAVRSMINVMRVYRDFKPLSFFGSVGLSLFSIGFLLGILLVYIFLATGRVGHVPSTILSMLLMVSGLQIILFAFLADKIRS